MNPTVFPAAVRFRRAAFRSAKRSCRCYANSRRAIRFAAPRSMNWCSTTTSIADRCARKTSTSSSTRSRCAPTTSAGLPSLAHEPHAADAQRARHRPRAGAASHDWQQRLELRFTPTGSASSARRSALTSKRMRSTIWAIRRSPAKRARRSARVSPPPSTMKCSSGAHASTDCCSATSSKKVCASSSFSAGRRCRRAVRRWRGGTGSAISTGSRPNLRPSLDERAARRRDLRAHRRACAA